jgi:hypothetical protein
LWAAAVSAMPLVELSTRELSSMEQNKPLASKSTSLLWSKNGSNISQFERIHLWPLELIESSLSLSVDLKILLYLI